MDGSVDYGSKSIRRPEWNFFEIGRQEEKAPEVSTEILSPWGMFQCDFLQSGEIFLDKPWPKA
jgi:hypothetical protein